MYLYIIQSHRGKYYVGVSANVIARLKRHNDGKVKSTKSDNPWAIKYTERHPDLPQARKRENQIKRWKSRTAIERLIHGPIV